MYKINKYIICDSNCQLINLKIIIYQNGIWNWIFLSQSDKEKTTWKIYCTIIWLQYNNVMYKLECM